MSSHARSADPVSVFLIWSTDYCRGGLSAEFGRIPKAFLPVNNRRIFEILAEMALAQHARIALAIPKDFELDHFDLIALKAFDVRLIRAPAGRGLGYSFANVASLFGTTDCELRMVQGARLMGEIVYSKTDVIAVAENAPRSPSIASAFGKLPAFAGRGGYFSLSSSKLFALSMTQTGGNVSNALSAYHRCRPLATVFFGRRTYFGSLASYLATRQHLIAPRSFNSIKLKKRTVVKSSHYKNKIRAEARWFSRVPGSLSAALPEVLQVGESERTAWYSLRYISALPLSHTFVFGRLPQPCWYSVFDACNRWLSACGEFRPAEGNGPGAFATQLYAEKSLRRLARFARSAGISTSAEWSINGRRLPSLERIASDAAAAIPPPADYDICVIHGDLSFGNMLYDFRQQSLRLIDPRGLDLKGQPSIVGDQRYDIGKLHHCVVGLYDLIIAGRYQMQWTAKRQVDFEIHRDPQIAAVQELFANFTFNGHTVATAAALPMSILLFLSMLPLHYDSPNRQRALLANVLRLHELRT